MMSIAMRVNWFSAVLLVLLFLNCGGTTAAAQSKERNHKEAAVSVSLCEVLDHPNTYQGKTLLLAVRIDSFKEGASIWDPACSKRGADLIVDPEHMSDPGIQKLLRELRLHGISDRPVMATIEGTFVEGRYDPVLKHRRKVFKAKAAYDVRQSSKTERR